MRQRLRPLLPDLAIVAVLFLVPLLFFLPQTLGGQTLLPADNLFQWEPYKSLAGEYGVGTPQNALLSDLILENVVWKEFLRDSVSRGQLPLWQPNILAGTPFLAAGQSSPLYPFTAIFLILPLWLAYGWFTVSQLWLAGVNVYILTRVLGQRRIPALIAALAYQLSGFMLVSVVFPMILATAAWLPFILAMVELTIRQGRALGSQPASIPWVALGAFGLGMAVLGGHVEALYFTLLVTGFYAGWRVIGGAIATRKEPDLWPRIARRVGWLIVLLVLGLALGSIQLAPAYELASRSFRQGAVSYDQVIGWAYPARRLLAFLMPNFFGNPTHHAIFDLFQWRMVPVTVNAAGDAINNTDWGIKNYVEGGAYLGIMAMALAVIAVAHWIAGRVVKPPEAGERRVPPQKHIGAEAPGKSYRLIFAVLSLLSLSFIFGTPTYALLYYGLPFINQSHSPFRWVWPLTLSVAVLAGFGAELVQELHQPTTGPLIASRTAQAHRGIINVTGWASLIGGGVILLGLIASRVVFASIEVPLDSAFRGLAKAPLAFADVRAFYSYEAGNALILALMLILTGVTLRMASADVRVKRFGWRPIWKPLAIAAVIVDLGVAIYGFNPSVDRHLLEVWPPAIARLQTDTIMGRSADFPPLDWTPYLWRYAIYEIPGADTMNSNIGWLNGLQEISGYDSLIPAQYAEFMENIQPQTDLPYNRIAPLYSDHPDSLNSALLDVLGVRYVVSETPIDDSQYVLAWQDEAVLIYENLDVAWRAFTLPAYSAVAYPEGGFADALNLPGVDVRRNVFVSLPQEEYEATKDQYPGYRGVARPAAITSYTPNELSIDVQADEPVWLVVGDSMYPGWRAWMREWNSDPNTEKEIPVTLVDGNFRGLMLEPGQWTIRMKYSPDSVRYGGFASFMSGMLIVFLFGVWLWRYAYKEDGSDASVVRRVAKNSLAPIVLNLFNRGIQFAFAFIMLRVLGPEGSGKYYYAVAIWGWFEIFSNFGLNTLLTREVSRDRDNANKYLVNTSLLRLGLAVIGVPLLYGFIQARQAFIDPPLTRDTILALWLLYGGLLLSTMSTGLTALFYAYEKAEVPAATQTVSTMLVAVLGVLVLLAGFGIVGLAGVSIIVNAVTLMILYTLTTRMFFRPKLTFDPVIQKMARGESFPLMLNHLLATLFFRVDVILLEAMRGDTVVGWYSVAYKWVDALNIIPAFFTQALFPVMSRQAAEDRPALLRSYVLSVKLLTLFSLPVVAVTILLGHFLVGLLGGAEFLPHGAIALQLFVLSIPIGWINSVTNYVVIAVNRQRALTWTFVAGVVFNLTANIIFIPRVANGYPAAAVITSFSELLLLILFYIVLRRALGPVNWFRTLWKPVSAAALMGGAAYGLSMISVPLAVFGSLAVYVGAVGLLRPFTNEELAGIAPLMPARFRHRIGAVEGVEAVPGEV